MAAKGNIRTYAAALSIAALVVADRGLKVWAETALPTEGIDIVWKWLRLNLFYNEGIAFSMPITGVFLKVLTVGLLAYVAYYFLKVEPHRSDARISAAYAAFFAGGLWNAYDRLFIGKVTDFIEVKYFAVFNFADIMVTCSAAFVILFHLLYERRNHTDPNSKSG